MSEEVEGSVEDFSEEYFRELINNGRLWLGTNTPIARRIQLLNSSLNSMAQGFHHKALLMNPGINALELHTIYQVINAEMQKLTQSINQQSDPTRASALLKQKYLNLKKGIDLYGSMEVGEMNLASVPVSNMSDLIISSLIDSDEGLIENSISSQINNLESSINSKVQSGIDNLTSLKEGLNLEKNYGEFIKDTVNSYTNSKKNNYKAFLGCLLAIAVISIYTLVKIQELGGNSVPWQVFGARILILLPIIWAAKFFHENYKQAFVAQIKFENIKNLIGGGIDSAVNYIDDDTAKREALRKFGTSIVDMSDLTNMIAKRTFKPEDVIKQAQAVADIARRNTKD